MNKQDQFDKSLNSASTIVVVQPANFGCNPETLSDNNFQPGDSVGTQQIHPKALNQFKKFTQKLIVEGVDVIIVKDSQSPVKPDAIFPNNWFTTHRDGRVIIYPMKAMNRRLQKGNPLLSYLESKGYSIQKIIDLSKFQLEKYKDTQENQKIGKFLQGTGSIIFDHQNKLAFACKSQRTDKQIFQYVCKQILNYQTYFFNSTNINGVPYYHTNVIMSICSDFVVICQQSVQNEEEKKSLKKALDKLINPVTMKKKAIVQITREQVSNFCGNILEVHNEKKEKILAMGTDSYKSFTKQQLDLMGSFCKIISVDVPTIQQFGGGGVRCMMAELFLPKKKE